MQAVLAWALMHVASAQESPIVQTLSGSVLGFDRDVQGQTVSSFQGIPFGTPPVGSLRFHYPEPFHGNWTEPLNASGPGPACSQSAASSEDCLYLNVYTPRKALASTTRPLPVMFWIYGGGFFDGDGWQGGSYDGANLAGRHDVVLVACNYRLSAMGFSTYVKGPNGERGSAGMADQRLAMQWSFNNIQAFGGDAARMTIFGESAGAFSVLYHLVSPPSWPFFSRAIVESGNSDLSWFFQPLDEAETLYAGWAEAVGCPAGSNQLQCLQAKPASAFTVRPKNYTGRSALYGSFPFGPVVDGTEHGLPGVPRDQIDAGKMAKVPIIIGANKEDASIFEPAICAPIPGARLEARNHHDVEVFLNWTFSPEDSRRIADMYPASEFRLKSINPHQKLLEQALRDLSFHCSNRDVATQWSQNGLDVYVYSFAFDMGPLLNSIPLGDFHGSEIPFVFKNGLATYKKLPFRGNVQGMSDIVSCMWTSFAYSGSPNGGSEVPPNCDQVHGKVEAWPQFGETRAFYSLNDEFLSRPKSVELRADNKYPDDEYPSDRRCDMWSDVTYPWRTRAAGRATRVLV